MLLELLIFYNLPKILSGGARETLSHKEEDKVALEIILVAIEGASLNEFPNDLIIIIIKNRR